MKITYTLTTPVGTLTNSFKDEKLVEGFQDMEKIFGGTPDPLNRTLLLQEFMKKNGLWGKALDNHYITNIEKTDDGEHWFFNKVN